MKCDCSRSDQGRAECPSPEACFEDPQLQSDERIRTARSLDELFGRRHFDPVRWDETGFPLRPALLAVAVVMVSLVLIVAFAVRFE